MAAASDSDDASDIFWPGYVDAVTNLAINLLFVIAILSIVMLTTAIQLSMMEKKKHQRDDVTTTKSGIKQIQEEEQEAAQKAMVLLKQLQSQVDSKTTADDASMTAKQLEAVMQNLQASLKKQAQEQTEQEQKTTQEQQKVNEKLQETQRQLAQAQQSLRALSAQEPPQEVLAKQRVITSPKGQNSVLELSSRGGVVVVFSPDVVELAESEASELVRKLTALGSIKSIRWELRVNSPKGFSEATRLAYYRVSTLRNVLLNNGVQPADIEMRVMEVDSARADNARVLVRPMP